MDDQIDEGFQDFEDDSINDDVPVPVELEDPIPAEYLAESSDEEEEEEEVRVIETQSILLMA